MALTPQLSRKGITSRVRAKRAESIDLLSAPALVMRHCRRASRSVEFRVRLLLERKAYSIRVR